MLSLRDGSPPEGSVAGCYLLSETQAILESPYTSGSDGWPQMVSAKNSSLGGRASNYLCPPSFLHSSNSFLTQASLSVSSYDTKMMK